MNAKEIEQGIIKEMVKPLFKKHQFNVAGKTFLKGEADFVKVFNIQSSAWNQKDSAKFTFNIGFFLPDTYEFWRQQPLPKHIKEYDCVFSLRPGPIIKSGSSDYWYTIDMLTDVSAVKNQIHDHLTNYILPFYHTYQTVADLLTLQEVDSSSGGSTRLQAGFILAKQGDYLLAKKVIHSYLQAGNYPDDWVSRIKSEAMKRGLNL